MTDVPPRHAPDRSVPSMSPEVMERYEKLTSQSLANQHSIARRTKSMTQSVQRLMTRLPFKMSKGLDGVQRLYYVQFFTSLGLLVAAALTAMAGFEAVGAGLGAIGGATVLISFIRTAPADIQKNRIDLAQWSMAYFTWLDSMLGANTMAQMVLSSENPDLMSAVQLKQVISLKTAEMSELMERLCEGASLQDALQPKRSPSGDPS